MTRKRNRPRTGSLDDLARCPVTAVVISELGRDRGPPERYQHGDVAIVEGNEAPHMRIRTQTMLDRYWTRQQIDARQFHAGRRLYGQWRAAGGEPRIICSYDSRRVLNIAGTPSDHVETDAQAHCRKALTAALSDVGVRLAAVLVHVCLIDGSAADWAAKQLLPKPDGIARLRAGLDALADHYGMPGGGIAA